MSVNNKSQHSVVSTNILPSISKYILNGADQENFLLKNYNLLVEKEIELDGSINKKTIDLVNNSIDVLNTNKNNSNTLRLFISNTAENQPWQQKDNIELDLKPAWVLRVEGKILGNESIPFSTLIKKINIHFDNFNKETLNIYEDDLSKDIEWDYLDNNNIQFNGLDIKRFGSQNRNVKITLELKNFNVSEYILPVINLNKNNGINKIHGNVQDMVSLIVEHVLKNGLIDQNTGLVDLNKDSNLLEIARLEDKFLATAFISLEDLIQSATKHGLIPLKPLKFDYLLRVDKETTFGENCYDIVINDSSLPNLKTQTEKSLRSHYLSELESFDSEINKLTLKNNKLLANLNNNIIPKYNFFNELSTQGNPAEFLQQFIEQQSKINKEIINQDSGYLEDVVRRSDYYVKNEQELAEEIGLLLQSGKI
ncbi:hypothetical protein QEN19_003689 [Hanseniaspora menglaensis]